MKRNAKITTLLLTGALCMSMVFTGCDKTQAATENYKLTDLDFAANTTLRMATGYNSADTGITFSSKVAGSGIKLADGKTYNAGDLKPTWVEVQTRLGMKFEDKYQGNNTTNEFAAWKEKLNEVDMLSGTAEKLSEAGTAGEFYNLADYLNVMPNFKAYLDSNPIVRLSITGSTSGENAGAIYFSPYFDGVNDIERMPLMRSDFIVNLLDGEGDFTATSSANLKTKAYDPYMPTTGSVAVEVVEKAANNSISKKTINKDYSKYGNIVAKMNEELAKGNVSGVTAVNMLRDYIDQTYNNYYGTTRSNLFVGQNAAWDADELVALLRCVVANSQTLNGTDTIQGIYSREDGNNQRRVDILSLAGILFGARGLESRSDYYYFDKEGNLKDARIEDDAYVAIEKMHDLYTEGLVSSDYNLEGTKATSTTNLTNDTGLMSYDYNQTQTLMNATVLNTNENETDEKYIAAMIPVAKWFDGTSTSGTYMRFTESWRSVKTDGWGISVSGINGDDNKLKACLKLIDYAYSDAGQILMSYGPDAFIKVKDASKTAINEKYETFNFNGKDMPMIAEATKTELWAKANGNYTNYARQYLGSTLSFLKSQAFEIQCTQDVGKEGAEIMSNAISLGTIKHPELRICENMWYTSLPTVFPTTATENTTISSHTELSSKGKFSKTKAYTNQFVDIITKGYTGEGTATRAATIASAKTTWGAEEILNIRKDAWTRLKNYFNSINA